MRFHSWPVVTKWSTLYFVANEAVSGRLWEWNKRENSVHFNNRPTGCLCFLWSQRKGRNYVVSTRIFLAFSTKNQLTSGQHKLLQKRDRMLLMRNDCCYGNRHWKRARERRGRKWNLRFVDFTDDDDLEPSLCTSLLLSISSWFQPILALDAIAIL